MNAFITLTASMCIIAKSNAEIKIENQSLYLSEAKSKTKPLKTTSSTIGVSMETYSNNVNSVKKSKSTLSNSVKAAGLQAIPSKVSTPTIAIKISQPTIKSKNKLEIPRTFKKLRDSNKMLETPKYLTEPPS